MTNKTLLIRADGNANIGAGHVMRCMSIGKAARELGLDVCFVTADKSFLSVIEESQFRVHILNSDYKKMEDELELLLPILEKENPDVMLLDSYYVTSHYMNELRILS